MNIIVSKNELPISTIHHQINAWSTLFLTLFMCWNFDLHCFCWTIVIDEFYIIHNFKITKIHKINTYIVYNSQWKSGIVHQLFSLTYQKNLLFNTKLMVYLKGLAKILVEGLKKYMFKTISTTTCSMGIRYL